MSLLLKTRLIRKLLDYSFRHPDKDYYVRELASLINEDPGNLSRQLSKLEIEGLYISRSRGKEKFYSLNKAYPLFNEFKKIILNSEGDKEANKTASADVYIVAGPNGSGKTTFAKTFLPEYTKCQNFINADLIAGGLSPFSPRIAAMKAGRLVLEQIRNMAERDVDFAFETTLSGKSYLNFFNELKRRGYQLHLFFLWIPNAELAIRRIKDRVAEGGHHVPTEDVRRRFRRSLYNLFKFYRPLLNSWTLFNNSGIVPELIAQEKDGKLSVIDEDLFEKITKATGAVL